MDILADVEERLLKAGLDHSKVRAVIADARQAWAGQDLYIYRYGTEPARNVFFRRNMQIYRDWQAGERAPLLARKYGISVKRVYAVLKRFSGCT
jgi:Mor family transcriptional regulator